MSLSPALFRRGVSPPGASPVGPARGGVSSGTVGLRLLGWCSIHFSSAPYPHPRLTSAPGPSSGRRSPGRRMWHVRACIPVFHCRISSHYRFRFYSILWTLLFDLPQLETFCASLMTFAFNLLSASPLAHVHESEVHPTHNFLCFSDLNDVPVTLRTVLEGLLAEYPSPEVLERYMPRIRIALVKLLRGLQAKQAPYWASVSRSQDSPRYSTVPGTCIRGG